MVEVDGGQLPGDEPVRTNLLGDDAIHLDEHRGQIPVGTSAVPVGRHCQVGDATRFEAVSHRVEDGDVGKVAVHGVVERVAGNVIGGLENPRDVDRGRSERERR